MSQTEPQSQGGTRSSLGGRGSVLPEPRQLTFVGVLLFALGFVAFALAYGGIFTLAPPKQASGFSAAGLSLVVAATIIKSQKVITNVAD